MNNDEKPYVILGPPMTFEQMQKDRMQNNTLVIPNKQQTSLTPDVTKDDQPPNNTPTPTQHDAGNLDQPPKNTPKINPNKTNKNHNNHGRTNKHKSRKKN